MNKYLVDAATFPGDARVAWRSDGAHGLWKEVAERTLYRVARSAYYDLYERDLASVKHVAPSNGLTIRMLAREEHAMLGTLVTTRLRARLDRAPLDRTVCAALRDGEVVGYSWWTRSLDSALDFSPLTLPHDAVFHGFVHVARSERHRGTAAALFSAGERHLLGHGARLCWFLLERTNVAGMRAARGRSDGHTRHIAALGYRKLPFRTTRTLTITDRS
jgi:GNAT superfamily N-acetyltransferase